MKVGISEPTVAAYLDHITDSFLFNKIDRWDVKGRRYLSSPSKYYAVDTGLRNARLNFRQTEMSHLMENAICNELLRRGYEVTIGKVGNTEVDFIAKKGDSLHYYQVTASLTEESTFQREIAPLQAITDNHPKIILTLDRFTTGNYDGIIVSNVIDWLLG
jgi:predicted AAA+ superfamily ATPase